jgi:hypothetical protein
MVPGPDDRLFCLEKTLEGSASKVELPPVRGAGYEPSASSGEPTGVAFIQVITATSFWFDARLLLWVSIQAHSFHGHGHGHQLPFQINSPRKHPTPRLQNANEPAFALAAHQIPKRYQTQITPSSTSSPHHQSSSSRIPPTPRPIITYRCRRPGNVTEKGYISEMDCSRLAISKSGRI